MAVSDLERRVSLLEASDAVRAAQLNELEGWRRRDEPRVQTLVEDGRVADQVRDALETANEHRWTNKQRLQAIAGAILIAIASNAHPNLHHLLHSL